MRSLRNYLTLPCHGAFPARAKTADPTEQIAQLQSKIEFCRDTPCSIAGAAFCTLEARNLYFTELMESSGTFRVKAGKSQRELIRKPSILIADKSQVSPLTWTARFVILRWIMRGCYAQETDGGFVINGC